MTPTPYGAPPRPRRRAWRDDLRASGIELTRFALRKVKWKDFDIDLLVFYVAGDKKLILVTQAPLAPKAIQVAVAGPSSDEARLSADLQEPLRQPPDADEPAAEAGPDTDG